MAAFERSEKVGAEDGEEGDVKRRDSPVWTGYHDIRRIRSRDGRSLYRPQLPLGNGFNYQPFSVLAF